MKIVIDEFMRSSKGNYRLLIQRGLKPKPGTIFRVEGSDEDSFVVVRNNFKYTYVETLNRRVPMTEITYESEDYT